MATPSVPQTVSAEASRDHGLTRSMVLLIGAAAIAIAAAGIHAAASIVAPIMLSLVLTIAVLPLTHWARHHGWPTLAGDTARPGRVVRHPPGPRCSGCRSPSSSWPSCCRSTPSDASRVTHDAKSFLTSHGIGEKPASTTTEQLDPSRVITAVTDILDSVLEALGNLFLLVTLLFFFCTALPLAGARFATLRRAKPELGESMIRFVQSTQRYLIMTALFGAIVAVLDTGALWLLGIPLPLVWGLFSFLTNFIPNIGFVIGVIPPALLGLLEGGWTKALTVVLVYSCLNVVIQTFIQPRYVGATVGLSAEMTFLSLVVWTFLLGALGALLAVPMTLLVRAIFLDPDPRAVVDLTADLDDPGTRRGVTGVGALPGLGREQVLDRQVGVQVERAPRRASTARSSGGGTSRSRHWRPGAAPHRRRRSSRCRRAAQSGWEERQTRTSPWPAAPRTPLVRSSRANTQVTGGPDAAKNVACTA